MFVVYYVSQLKIELHSRNNVLICNINLTKITIRLFWRKGNEKTVHMWWEWEGGERYIVSQWKSVNGRN